MTATEELLQLSDGPDYGRHLVRTLVKPLIVFMPVLATLGGLAGYSNSHGMDGTPFIVFDAIILGIILLFALIIPTAQANLRRRRDILLGQLASSSSSSQIRLAWTAWLVDAGKRYDGSLHLNRGVLRFLWHQAANIPLLDPRSEMVLELSETHVAAIETEGAGSLGEWWRSGTPVVVLILHDGRRIRVGAPGADALATALRERIGRPEGTPIAPSPADFTLEEIGQSLVRRNALVALVVKGQDGLAPFVVLHGNTEELRGALENAREAVVQDRKALAPYAKGLIAADPRPQG